jgi:hypothetical protein
MRMGRLSLVSSFAAGLAVIAVTGPVAASDQGEARAETPAELTVGARLEALADVPIGQAEVAKGSKVSVIKLLHRQGRLASVFVELADGQVARVAVTKIRTFFRVVTD